VPLFRVRTPDGGDQIVEAHRVIADTLHTSFEHRNDGQWHTVLELLNDTVAAVHRRIHELDGRWRWTIERPQRALGVRHPV
jgi:hypothetical protein